MNTYFFLKYFVCLTCFLKDRNNNTDLFFFNNTDLIRDKKQNNSIAITLIEFALIESSHKDSNSDGLRGEL